MTRLSVSILGCGYLGLPLAKRLLAREWRVLGSTTTPDKIPLLKEAGILPFYISFEPHCVSAPDKDFFSSDILFINIPFRRQLQDPWDYYKQIQAVMSFIEKPLDKYLLFASSTSVYPSSLENAVEEVEIQPENERAKVLLAVEQMMLDQQATILRFAGLYGGVRKIGRFLAGKPAMGHGLSPVNLVHYEDCVAITEEIMMRNEKGEVFNVCSDEHPTREYLYTQKASHMGLELPQFQNSGQPATKQVANRKIKKCLNYQFLYPSPLHE